ncbi:hypothetical protein COO60DRAFT_1496813 [Scenedesmus sp. NREL 46B-D3]|nr:hypothetical protein COO60DRAFT_1496813 [Scenedesmus sp. NREL 46B-D3]
MHTSNVSNKRVVLALIMLQLEVVVHSTSSPRLHALQMSAPTVCQSLQPQRLHRTKDRLLQPLSSRGALAAMHAALPAGWFVFAQTGLPADLLLLLLSVQAKGFSLF